MKRLVFILLCSLFLTSQSYGWNFTSGGGGGTTVGGLTPDTIEAADDGKYLIVDWTNQKIDYDTPPGGGDMTQAVWDGDTDGFIDADAGGTDQNSSAWTGVATISTGTWSAQAQLTHELGGLEADVNDYTGLLGISAGATAEVDTAAELETYAGLGEFANEYLDDADAATMRATLGVTATADDIIQASSWSGGDLSGTGLAPQVDETGVDHDLLLNFAANEHIDWTSDQGATNIDAGNIPDLSATYEPADAAIVKSDEAETLTAVWTLSATSEFIFTEKADHTSTPGAGFGYLWVKNTSPSTIIFTNDDGTDTTLGAGGGSGDITDVGPGYDTGAAFTDGLASTGTEMLVWEGTSVDTNELKIISPTANPGSDIDITLPSVTGTLIYTYAGGAGGALDVGNTTAFTPDADHEPATKKYVDDNIAAGSVSGVGDCAGGACYDGTSDGGTYARFYSAAGPLYLQLATTTITSASKTATFQDVTGTVYVTGGTDISLADGGTGESLSGPAADRVMFYDFSDTAVEWMSLKTNVFSLNASTNELTLSDHNTARQDLGLEIGGVDVGSDIQAYDADLDTLSSSTAWRLFYSNGSSVITELALGANGTFLESNGTTSAPAFRNLEAADIPDISATYETQLTNSAGLYGALDDETGSASGTPLAVFNQNPTIDGFVLGGAITGIGTTDEFQAAANNNIVFQMGDAAGTYYVELKDSDGTMAHRFYSDGRAEAKQDTTGGYSRVLEGSAGGTNYRGWKASDSLADSFDIEWQDEEPTVGNFMYISAFSDVGDLADVSFGNFDTNNFEYSGAMLRIKALGVSMAELNASGVPGSGNYLRGDGSWQTVTPTPAPSDTYFQYNNGGAMGGASGLTYDDTALTTIAITADTDPALEVGDGTHTITNSGVDLYVEGTSEFDGTIYAVSLDVADGNITNVGSIALDSISADATNVLFGSGAATQLQFRASTQYIASLDAGYIDIEATTAARVNTDLIVSGQADSRACGGEQTGATVTISSTCSYSGIYYNGDNDVIEFDLPAGSANMQYCFHENSFAQVITVDPNGTEIIILDGTAETGGEAIVSTGAGGDSICLAFNGTEWVSFGNNGPWDGAVD